MAAEHRSYNSDDLVKLVGGTIKAIYQSDTALVGWQVAKIHVVKNNEEFTLEVIETYDGVEFCLIQHDTHAH